MISASSLGAPNGEPNKPNEPRPAIKSGSTCGGSMLRTVRRTAPRGGAPNGVCASASGIATGRSSGPAVIANGRRTTAIAMRRGLLRLLDRHGFG